jgi:hypothetical protein
MTYALPVHLAVMDGRLDQTARKAVASYRLAIGRILAGTGIEVGNPFPLYYPGMPAYDAARLSEEKAK